MKYLGDENISYSWNFQSWGSILNSNIIHIKDNFAKLETSGQNQSEMQKLLRCKWLDFLDCLEIL